MNDETSAARKRRMKVVVDLSRCEVFAQCVFASPTTFVLHGDEVLEYDPSPDEAAHEQVILAARACPVQAISIGWSEEPEDMEARVP
ncbi:ferredoxin [Chondromyces apiculatus]|nr:ferredoxin [Chondromyces apiculatus]